MRAAAAVMRLCPATAANLCRRVRPFDRKAPRFKLAHDVFELHPLDRHARRQGHDTPHDVQRHRVHDLLETDLGHRLPKFRKLLDKLRHRLLQVQFLFHIYRSYRKDECPSHCNHYSRYFFRVSSYLLPLRTKTP